MWLLMLFLGNMKKKGPSFCWVCVIFFACVCVGASKSTTASDDPSSSVLGAFLGGSQGGQVCPPWLRAAPQNLFLGGFCYF
jgi:hypothetical protein